MRQLPDDPFEACRMGGWTCKKRKVATMNMVTRLGIVVFVIAAVLGIGVLAVLWFSWEPLLPMAYWLVGMDWFNVALLVVLGIVALGLVVLLIYALAAKHKGSELSLRHNDGTVTITKEAIRSTAERTLARNRGIKVNDLKIGIHGKRNPDISVKADVEPGSNADLASLGESLMSEVASSISLLTGYPVKRVDITFAGKTKAPSASAATTSTRAHPIASTRKEVPHVEYKRQSQGVLST